MPSEIGTVSISQFNQTRSRNILSFKSFNFCYFFLIDLPENKLRFDFSIALSQSGIRAPLRDRCPGTLYAPWLCTYSLPKRVPFRFSNKMIRRHLVVFFHPTTPLHKAVAPKKMPCHESWQGRLLFYVKIISQHRLADVILFLKVKARQGNLTGFLWLVKSEY